LLGCHAAKSIQSAEEQEMVAEYARKMDEKEKLKYGLMTAFNVPRNDRDFQIKCQKFCEDNNLDGVYILAKTKGKYQLFSMKNDWRGIREKVTDIPPERIEDGKILWKNNKEIKFPPLKKAQTGNLQWSPVRDKNNPLKKSELAYIRGLTDKADRFDKAHHKYKEDKKRYPFLAKLEAQPEDLLPSLMQKLADEISTTRNIRRDITLHGPTKAMHVDTAKRDFEMAETHLYHSEYNQSLFFSGQSNIDYQKLKKEREQEIKNMEGKGQPKPAGNQESKAKQIKVTIRGKRW
jgi:hypothetical protein